MHFRPISRISSAVCTACALSCDVEVATLKSCVRASGEFIVIVVAVCDLGISSNSVEVATEDNIQI